LHRLRHVVSELVKRMPERERQSEAVSDLAEYGCLTRMHVVRLLAPTIDGEDHMKDIDFSAAGICARWEAGVADTRAVIGKAPWLGEFDPIEGVILHEARAGTQVTSG
jgi:NTE family protein